MNRVKQVHRQAMERADMAAEAFRLGDTGSGKRLLAEACDLETQAARMAVSDGAGEPTQSVLFRSAASFALECGYDRQAEKLICEGLAGDAPDEIADELRDLLEQVNFHRHLELRGIELSQTEVQMSLAGGDVGFGIAAINIFVPRILQAERLFSRTADRINRVPFRPGAAASGSRKEKIEVFATVPRAASFAVSLSFGYAPQMQLPGMTSLGETVIDEVLDCLELFHAGEHEQLARRIESEDYHTNFAALARALAPDGRRVKLVGFSASRAGKARRVTLTRTQSELGRPGVQPETSVETAAEVELRGFLREADSRDSKRGRIQVIDAEGASHSVIVAPGLMSDIVKPLWESEVVIIGARRGKAIHLTDISPVEPDPEKES